MRFNGSLVFGNGTHFWPNQTVSGCACRAEWFCEDCGAVPSGEAIRGCADPGATKGADWCVVEPGCAGASLDERSGEEWDFCDNASSPLVRPGDRILAVVPVDHLRSASMAELLADGAVRRRRVAVPYGNVTREVAAFVVERTITKVHANALLPEPSGPIQEPE